MEKATHAERANLNARAENHGNSCPSCYVITRYACVEMLEKFFERKGEVGLRHYKQFSHSEFIVL
jgi:hypothetical protein